MSAAYYVAYVPRPPIDKAEHFAVAMLRIEVLPASCGDCLWLEYGQRGATRIVIVDGGVRATANALRERIAVAMRERGSNSLEVELLVVTHIDNDHIQGIIELLKDSEQPLQPKEIWFNGWAQLNALPPLLTKQMPLESASASIQRKLKSGFMGGYDSKPAKISLSDNLTPGSGDSFLGPAQGDELSGLLNQLKWPWNRHFSGGAVVVSDHGVLPEVKLEGGLHLTLLGPDLRRLHNLRKMWNSARDGNEERLLMLNDTAMLARSDVWPPTWNHLEENDTSVTNGSSIAILAKYEGNSLLLAGDAHASDVTYALDRLLAERHLHAPLPLAALKLAHHGSAKNVTRELLEKIDCACFLVSTDGSSHRHPDNQALLRILRYTKHSPRIYFNYASATTRRWGDSKDDVVRGGFQKYEATYPRDNVCGTVVEWD